MADVEVSCRLCGVSTRPIGRQRLLDKYDVEYFSCPRCDLIQTELPYWLDEAYAQAISRLDTGAVTRNQMSARLTAVIATLLELPANARCLDYGGGHGVFVRMMRDLGREFRWFDKYAENHYALGFEGDVTAHYALVTAFEVLEHFADVRGDLEQLFASQPDHVLVGTVLHAGHQPGWWYYLLESGQHVAFYSRRTMAWIAEKFGYDVIAGNDYSLFVRRPLGAIRRALLSRLVERPGVAALVPRPVYQRRTLVEADHEAMRLRKGQTP